MPAPDLLDDAEDCNLILTLGYGGLIPFVLLAALLWLVEPDLQGFVAIALAAYASLIAAFLGGIHWGLGWSAGALGGLRRSSQPHAQRRHFLWGVVPSLLAWPGMIMPPYAGLAWLGFVLMLSYLADRSLYPHAGLQRWLTLRFRLSAVASLSCFIGAGAL
jgi:hypothetical protein